jgi:hypothetical protein
MSGSAKKQMAAIKSLPDGAALMFRLKNDRWYGELWTGIGEKKDTPLEAHGSSILGTLKKLAVVRARKLRDETDSA